MRIGVGSSNPAKVAAVKEVVSKLDKEVVIQSLDVSSGVSSQPFSNQETKEGASNRAKACVSLAEVDIGIGLEGGVIDDGDTMYLCNWGALATIDQQLYVASGAKIHLPNYIAEKVRAGLELGEVMADFTKDMDVRKKEGAIGIFTAGYITRNEMFSHVVKLLVGQYKYYNSMLKD